MDSFTESIDSLIPNLIELQYFQSDDDINTTTSDIDSQPATPSSQIDMSQPRTPMYTDDGLFKIPRIRNDSISSQMEQEYSIATQTRSKISYAETPIEQIEATLQAPDVTNDMYPDILDMDPDWTEFLFSCMNPSKQTACFGLTWLSIAFAFAQTKPKFIIIQNFRYSFSG